MGKHKIELKKGDELVTVIDLHDVMLLKEALESTAEEAESDRLHFSNMALVLSKRSPCQNLFVLKILREEQVPPVGIVADLMAG